MSAVLATLSGSYPPLGGRSPTCYSAVRHCPPKGAVRLACFRHAASVYPEPGSNSPSELSESPILHPLRLQMACSSDDLSTDRHAPHHSSIVNVPRAPDTGPPARRSRAPRRPTTIAASTEGGQGMALAPTDCPTRLLAQYRRRWGVSRPCSGRERVGPPRWGHQGHRLTRIEPRGLARPASGPARPGRAGAGG
jgi:hypothetical protein